MVFPLIISFLVRISGRERSNVYELASVGLQRYEYIIGTNTRMQ